MPSDPLPAATVLARWAHDRGVVVERLLAGLLVAGLEARGLGVAEAGAQPLLALAGDDPPDVAALPVAADEVTPDLLGEVLGASVAVAGRTGGVVFTPRPAAEGLVRVALAARPADAPARVVDPSVGGGAFVLAVLRALVAVGVPPDEAVVRVAGVDADPRAVAVTCGAVALWGADHGIAAHAAVAGSGAVRHGDFLLDPPPLDGPVDLVVGNPPFLSQLRRATTRGADELDALRGRFGTAAGAYTDAAALFLLAALDLVGEGGVVALMQPRSFLGADGAREVRRRLHERAALVALWEPSDRVFPGVAVDVCAPVLVAGGAQPAEVQVHHDVDLRGPALERRAGDLLGDDPGLALASSRDDQPPTVALPAVGGRLGDLASVTAGFRDQFYGMAPHVHEAEGGDERPRLVTSGLIDPGRNRWGERAARYARRTWTAPVLDAAALDPDGRVGRWVAARLVPKVVVASQTRVVEAFLDLDGVVVPSPPAIAVEGPPEVLPRLLAALLSPAVTAWIHRRAAGTGMAPDALRVSVADVADVPLPGDHAAWDRATALLADVCAGPGGRPLGDDEATRAFAAAMADAYGLPPLTGDAATAWWLARLPAATSS